MEIPRISDFLNSKHYLLNKVSITDISTCRRLLFSLQANYLLTGLKFIHWLFNWKLRLHTFYIHTKILFDTSFLTKCIIRKTGSLLWFVVTLTLIGVTWYTIHMIYLHTNIPSDITFLNEVIVWKPNLYSGPPTRTYFHWYIPFL